MPENENRQTRADADRQALVVIEQHVRAEQPVLEELLPIGIPAARAIETVLAAARKTPELRECTPESFAYSLREAARWGLIPDGVMGQGYLIPRINGRTGQKEATFQAGYRGLEELARRSGIVGSIVSGWVCENDPIFKASTGLHGDLIHEPALNNRGDIKGFYAAAWLTNGAPPVVVYMPVEEVIAIRDTIAGWQRGPWRTWFAQMGRKTAVRRLVGQLPLSADVQAIIGMDDEPWEKATNVTPSEEPSPVTEKAQRLTSMIATRHDPPEPSGGERAPEPMPASPPDHEKVTGTVAFENRPGLDGNPTITPSGQVMGFRLDSPEGWYQIILSGDVLADFQQQSRTLDAGATLTVTGSKVVIPQGEDKPPLLRIIVTENLDAEVRDPE